MAAAAKAVGGRQGFISSTEACANVMVKAFRGKTHQDFAIFLHPDTTPENGNCLVGGLNPVFQRLVLSGYCLRGLKGRPVKRQAQASRTALRVLRSRSCSCGAWLPASSRLFLWTGPPENIFAALHNFVDYVALNPGFFQLRCQLSDVVILVVFHGGFHPLF